MGLLWDYYGISMGLLWDYHGDDDDNNADDDSGNDDNGQMIIVFREGWDPLCKFLRLEPPDGNFPRCNKISFKNYFPRCNKIIVTPPKNSSSSRSRISKWFI